jgi:TetR/AcrR family transcriptional repressor of nem operon
LQLAHGRYPYLLNECSITIAHIEQSFNYYFEQSLKNTTLETNHEESEMARPAQFEREAVLDKAMQAFWDHGYCATSMAELMKATGLQPGSLYGAFDSKQGLFLAALDHYGERGAGRLRQALADADSPLQGIRGFFRRLAGDIADPKARRSCLLVNTVLELSRQDAAVQQRVNSHLDAMEELFRQALEAARTSGELAPDKDPAALAAFLMTSIWGLRVLGGTDPAPERVHAVLEQLLAQLD